MSRKIIITTLGIIAVAVAAIVVGFYATADNPHLLKAEELRAGAIIHHAEAQRLYDEAKRVEGELSHYLDEAERKAAYTTPARGGYIEPLNGFARRLTLRNERDNLLAKAKLHIKEAKRLYDEAEAHQRKAEAHQRKAEVEQ